MRRRPFPLVAILVVVAVACAGSDGSGDGSPSPPSVAGTTPPATSAPSDGVSPDAGAIPEALDFVAPAIDGGQVHGAEYAGGDVVLWMWAPW